MEARAFSSRLSWKRDEFQAAIQDRQEQPVRPA